MFKGWRKSLSAKAGAFGAVDRSGARKRAGKAPRLEQLEARLAPAHNITVVAGGTATLAQVDQFADTPAVDLTIDPATIAASATPVVLQANNDVIFLDDVSLASGVSFTVQAGRSIQIDNLNITTTNADINFTANETLANGVIDARRDPGIARIVKSKVSPFITATTDGDITLLISTGAGLTNSTSGNIDPPILRADPVNGNVLVRNNGPTPGSGIVSSIGATPAIRGASAALDANGPGGFVGTSGSPVSVGPTHVTARAGSGGIFLSGAGASGAVTIGGSALGGLTGLSTSSNGPISFAAGSATDLIISEAVAANGAGGVTLASTNTIAVNAAVSSGSGAISLQTNAGITLSGTGSVNTTGTYTANADNDANGTGAYTQNAGSTVSSTAADVIAADVNLAGTLNGGTGFVGLRPAQATANIGVEDAAQGFNLTDGDLDNVSTSAGVVIGGGGTNGDISIGVDNALTQGSKNFQFITRANIAIGGRTSRPPARWTFGQTPTVTASAISPPGPVSLLPRA